MKGGLEVVILNAGFVFSHARGQQRQELRGEEIDVGQGLAAFCEKHSITIRTVNLFIAEELVFGLELDLPLRTPDLKEAVGLQMGLALPFPQEEALSAYSVVRQVDGYQVMVFATRIRTVAGVLDELIEDGFTVKGIYPEHQRYLTTRTSRQEWALVMPGRPNKVYVFAMGGQLTNRLLLPGESPSFDELSERCGTSQIYHLAPEPGSKYTAAVSLLVESPLLKEYNMLPASYRRPDYLKMVIAALLVMNFIALAAGIGFRFHLLAGMAEETEAEIAELMPQVAAANSIREQVAENEKFLTDLEKIGGNIDLIGFVQKLTTELPPDSYLEQLRFDGAQNIMAIHGYSDDLGEMTKSLQGLGEVRLKSTSRRKNRNYFQVEIALP